MPLVPCVLHNLDTIHCYPTVSVLKLIAIKNIFSANCAFYTDGISFRVADLRGHPIPILVYFVFTSTNTLITSSSSEKKLDTVLYDPSGSSGKLP